MWWRSDVGSGMVETDEIWHAEAWAIWLQLPLSVDKIQVLGMLQGIPVRWTSL